MDTQWTRYTDEELIEEIRTYTDRISDLTTGLEAAASKVTEVTAELERRHKRPEGDSGEQFLRILDFARGLEKQHSRPFLGEAIG